MGFSSTSNGGGEKAAPRASFGDVLLNYFQNRYPIAGGLANMAFGGDEESAAPASGMATAPTAPAPPKGMQQPDYGDLISMNAKPQSNGGGLSTIIKLLAGI